MAEEDPVFKGDDGKWYFWDETFADKCGPFRTEGIARKRLEEYCKRLTDETNDEAYEAEQRRVQAFAYNKYVTLTRKGKQG